MKPRRTNELNPHLGASWIASFCVNVEQADQRKIAKGVFKESLKRLSQPSVVLDVGPDFGYSANRRKSPDVPIDVPRILG